MGALAEKGIHVAETVIEGLFSSGCFSYSTPHAETHWYTCVNGNLGLYDGQVMSCYYHPYQQHSATTIGKAGTKTVIAPAGQWAISHQTKATSGNKCKYNTAGTADWHH